MEPIAKNSNPLLKLFRQSSHYLAGNIMVMVTGFITMPILTRALSTADYGVLSLVSVTVFTALSLAKGGLQEAAVRFYSEFKNGNRPDLAVYYNTLFWSSATLALIAGLVFGGAGLFWHDNISDDDALQLVLIIAGMVISGGLFMRLSNFLRAEQNTKHYNLFMILQRYSILAFGFLAMFNTSRPLLGFLAGNLIGEIVVVIVLLGLFIFHGKIRRPQISSAFLKECLRFGIPLVGFELASYLLKIADRYLVKIFLGSEAVGIYSLAYNLCSYLNDALFFAVWYAVYPIYMDLWQKKGEAETAQFLTKASTYLLLLALPVIWGFSALSTDAITYIASEKYLSAVPFVPYLLIGMIFWGFVPIFGAGLYIHKQTKTIAALTFAGLILNVGLDLYLIPRYQLFGAAIGTLVSYAFLISLVVWKAFPYLRVSIDGRMLAKALAASLVMYAALVNLDHLTGLAWLFGKILIGAGIYFVAMLSIDRNLRQTAGHVIGNRLLFSGTTLS